MAISLVVKESYDDVEIIPWKVEILNYSFIMNKGGKFLYILIFFLTDRYIYIYIYTY